MMIKKLEKGILLFLLLNLSLFITSCTMHEKKEGKQQTSQVVQEDEPKEKDLVFSSPVIISRTSYGQDRYLSLQMYKGEYIEDNSQLANPGVAGKRFKGYFKLMTEDSSDKEPEESGLGEVLSSIELEEEMLFPMSIAIEFDDYNNDGNPDFTLGQYGNDVFNRYKMYTIIDDQITFLHSFNMSSTQRYTAKLDKLDELTYTFQFYRREEGKYKRIIKTWDGEKFVKILPEPISDLTYKDWEGFWSYGDLSVLGSSSQLIVSDVNQEGFKFQVDSNSVRDVIIDDMKTLTANLGSWSGEAFFVEGGKKAIYIIGDGKAKEFGISKDFQLTFTLLEEGSVVVECNKDVDSMPGAGVDVRYTGQYIKYTNEKPSDIVKRVQSFIPEGWQLALTYQDAVLIGDLNNDGLDDLTVIMDKEITLGEKEERNLMILVGQDDGTYRLALKAEMAVRAKDEGGTFGDPFMGLSIDRGSLIIQHYGGSSWRWGDSCRFRYQDGGWYLIGITLDSFSAINTANREYEDINLLTGDYIKITTDDEGVEKEVKGNRGVKPLVNLVDYDVHAYEPQY